MRTVLRDILRFAVTGGVFYGLSLALLRVCPLKAGWGVIYAASSWLLFVVAFFPTLPVVGMMRRQAYRADSEHLPHNAPIDFVPANMVVLIGFGLVQAAFLWHVTRRIHAKPDTSA